MQIPEEKLSAIREAIYGGAARKLVAIKQVRETTGCDLKAAKEPQKVSTWPGSKGCGGVLTAGMLVLAGVGVVVAMKQLI